MPPTWTVREIFSWSDARDIAPAAAAVGVVNVVVVVGGGAAWTARGGAERDEK
jgi:hypothetical protein